MFIRNIAARVFGFAAVILLASSALLATSANAAFVEVDNLGTLTPGTSGTFNFNTDTIGTFGDALLFDVSEDMFIEASAFEFDNPSSDLDAGTFEWALVDFASPEISLGTYTDGVLDYGGVLTSGIQYALIFIGDPDAVRGHYEGEYSVSAVPLPAAVWLFLSALIGLAGVLRLKRTNKLPRSAENEGLAAA